MKLIALSLMVLPSSVMAETFKLPAGITFRAKGVGYDCGEFTTDAYKAAPKEYAEKHINFLQLAADKDLNTFLIEATFPNPEGIECTYGAFFNRSRDAKTLELDHSELITTAVAESCAETVAFLDEKLNSLKYFTSKRGIRFIAVELLNQQNEICETNIVRTVFDRR